jgi:predicted nucleic acid-binding protein
MNYLLDTNVLSEFRKSSTGKIDSRVKSWAEAVPDLYLYLSAVTVFEIEVGVLLKERRDRFQGRLLRTWMEEYVLRGFAGRILPFDAEIAQRCAVLHVPNPRPERDAMIAATALVYGMTVVTRHVADFETAGIPVLNPWLA